MPENLHFQFFGKVDEMEEKGQKWPKKVDWKFAACYVFSILLPTENPKRSRKYKLKSIYKIMKKLYFLSFVTAAMLLASVPVHSQYITEAPAGGFDFSQGKDYVVVYAPEAQVTAIGSKMLSNQNLDPNMEKNQFYYWTADWDATLFTLYDIEDTQKNSWGGSMKLNMTPLFEWGAGHFGAKAKPYDLSCITNDHILHIGFMNIGGESATNNFKFLFGPKGSEIKLVVNKAVGESAGDLIGVGNAPALNKWYYLDIPIKDLLDYNGDFGFVCDFSKPTGTIIFNAGFDGATPSKYTVGAVDPDTGMKTITITEKGSALAIDGVFLYKADDTSGIQTTVTGGNDGVQAVYDLAGRRAEMNRPGIYVVKTANGVKKVAVK